MPFVPEDKGETWYSGELKLRPPLSHTLHDLRCKKIILMFIIHLSTHLDDCSSGKKGKITMGGDRCHWSVLQGGGGAEEEMAVGPEGAESSMLLWAMAKVVRERVG